MNLPNAEEAERAIVGALMINPVLIGQADLSADDFYWPSARESYRAICGLIEEEIELSPALIHERTEIFGRPVSVVEISQMLDAANGLRSIRNEVGIVKEKARKRRIAKLTAALNAGALNGECSEDLIDQGERALEELRQELGARRGAFRSLREIDIEAGSQFDRLRRGDCAAIPTGFAQLDYTARGGIQPGEVWVVAALTGRGKSAWALQAARFQAQQGYPVAIVSREMGDIENYTRLLCGASGLSMWKVRPGMHMDTYETLVDWRKPTSELPIFINSSTSGASELRTLVKELVKAEKIKTLFVDYLQLLEIETRNGTRATEVAAISRILKQIAMDNQIGVFSLAQFNRLANHGERPELHHLAESGGIEKDASLALILDMNEEREGEKFRPCAMRIAKHRNGPRPTLKYQYHGESLTFWECDK